MSAPETVSFFAVPDEALFAGPPRSQVKGEAHHAETLFPPPPSTFQGAVRTRILFAAGVPLDDRAAIEQRVGTAAAMPAGWHIDGPWVAEVSDGEIVPWVATPACIGHSGPEWCVLGTRARGEAVLDAGAPDELPEAGIVEGLEDRLRPGWVDAPALAALLAGRYTRLPTPDDRPFAFESRVGLEIDDTTRTAEQANLYFRKAVRLGRNDGVAGLYASLGTPAGTGLPADALTTGHLRIGRRGRPLALAKPPPLSAAWRDIVAGAHLGAIEPADGDLFWLVLASPVSLPDPPTTGTPVRPRLPALRGCHADVVAAVHLPPVVLGGLDLATRRSKPNRAFLMPGSAWGIRLRGGSPLDRRLAMYALHHQCTLGPVSDRPFGFGRTWIALPKPETP